MSAWFLAERHIDVLLSAMVWHEHIVKNPRDGKMVQLSIDRVVKSNKLKGMVTRLGRSFMRANAIAMKERYPDDFNFHNSIEIADAYKFRYYGSFVDSSDRSWTVHEPYVGYKLASCLLYQCMERHDFEKTMAFKTIIEARKRFNDACEAQGIDVDSQPYLWDVPNL